MQITIKSVKVGKTGTSAKGDWELIVITSEDGTDYRTFQKSAKNLIAGTVIDIGETVIKEGKITIKEYTVVSAPAAPALPNDVQPAYIPGGAVKIDTSQDMTPEKWAEKDERQRLSIETQVAYKGIMELAGAHENPISEKFEVIFDAALDWAMAHFKTSQPSAKPAPEPLKSKSEDLPDLHGMVFADAGKLKTALQNILKMSASQIQKETAGFDLTTEEGRKQAWMQIIAVYREKPDE